MKFWTLIGAITLAIGSLAGLILYKHEKIKGRLTGYSYRNG